VSSPFSFDPASETLLKRRAELLARQSNTAEANDDVEVLVCRLGTERYAVQTASLRSVQWVQNVVPVPCTPSYVVGIVSVRGDIVTLLDLATMLGLTASPTKRDGQGYPALLLGLPSMRAGLVVDEVLGVEHLSLASLQPSLSGRDFTRGVAAGPTIVLDVEALFANGRFSVDES
jgi:purine-binding chemotaxis protein CheW